MKKYEEPVMEMIYLQLTDVLTTSGDDTIIDEEDGITIPGGF